MTSSAVPDLVHKISELISESDHFVIFTGAGISTPSGIPDFRSANSGLWTQSDPMQVASLTAFRHHPEKFFDWLRPLTRQICAAQPNPAHIALAHLEAAGYLKAVITQNIDGLHQRAGSQTVLEVHGSMNQMFCESCRTTYPTEAFLEPFVNNGIYPRCERCQSYIRPAITLFEEMLPEKIWQEAYDHSRAADVYMVAGSSLEVFPANNLPQMARRNGAKIIINTRSETFLDPYAQYVIHEDVAVVLPMILEELLPAGG